MTKLGLKGLDAKTTLARLAALDGVDDLVLEDCKLGAKQIAALAAAVRAGLRRLGLPRCKVNPKLLGELSAALPEGELEALDLRGDPLGDEGAALLASAPAFGALRELGVGATKLKAAGIAALVDGTALTRLERFVCGSDKIGLDGAFALAEATWPLTHFTSFRQDLKAKGVERFATHGPTTLRSLKLYEVGTGPAAVEAIAGSKRLTRLEVLVLRGDNVSDAGLTALAAAPSLAGLRELGLASSNVGDAGVRALVGSPHVTHLERLDLSVNRRIGIDGVRHLAGAEGLRRLKSLRLSTLRLGRDGLAALLSGEWPALEELDLGWAELGDAGLELLLEWGGLARLRRLDLATNALTEAGLKRLADHPSVAKLDALNVWQNPCEQRAVEIARASRHLRPEAVTSAISVVS